MELELDEYFKKINELIAKGLYADEADAVIEGKCTFEEALEQHKAATLNEYLKKSNELLEKGLTFDEVDHVLHGDITLEEALEQHKVAVLNESADSEYKEVEMETAEDAEKIMAEVRRITAERSK